MKKIDMTGWKMWEHGIPDSKLAVIEQAEPHITKSGIKQICWRCKCLCGKEIIVKGNSLRNGNTKSCGCLKKEQLSERNAQSSSVKVGQKYGKLTIIQDLGMRKQKSRNQMERWSLCQCDCGNKIEVPNNMLQNGQKKSCGCLHSYGEFIVEQLLKENNVQYIKEYSFKDLLGKNNGKLRFDFAIFENTKLLYLIEVDGKQHFTGPEAKWTQSQSFEDIQYHDSLKDNYCRQNSIQLKRIPYTEIKGLKIEQILSTQYDIVIKEK